MDPSRVTLVVCLTLFMAIGIPAALYVALSRKNSVSQIELMRRAANRARQPWAPEDASLKELSQLVAELKNPEGDSEASDSNGR